MNRSRQQLYPTSRQDGVHTDSVAASETNSLKPRMTNHGTQESKRHAADDSGEHDFQKMLEQAWPLGTELYCKQRSENWPTNGHHILAHYDDASIVVYQAFCPEIASSAVKNQRFGGGGFSFTRMSWIKTNFLWMMYRSGWATKPKQERILAVRITLDGFNQILSAAYTVKLQKAMNVKTENIEVRLQWDPDHDTSGESEVRRAIQLGLKNQILKTYCTQWIVSITDVTDFVRQQHKVLQDRGHFDVHIPRERVFIPPSADVCRRIELDLK